MAEILETFEVPGHSRFDEGTTVPMEPQTFEALKARGLVREAPKKGQDKKK